MSAPLRVYNVVPPTGVYVREDRCQTPVENLKTIALRPPIDLMYAAAAFQSVGCECRLDDYPAQGLDREQLEREIRDWKPDIVLLSITTQTLPKDMDTAALIKSIDRGIVTAAKGAHFNVFDREVMEAYPALDIAMRGEIEEACAELGDGRPLSEISGIIWRDADGAVVRNADRPFPNDLDSLPYPERDLIDNSLYTRPDTGAPQTSIVTNRGCPFHCIYCLANQTAGERNRYRSVANVIGEIEECIERHGIRNFLFRSDLFTQNKTWVIELCRAIVERKLDIEWACNSRVDTLNPELLGWMRKAGCWIMSFGVESGDQATLDRLAKKTRVEDSYRAVALCREADIKSSVYLLMGLPWDTIESVEQLVQYSQRLDPDFLEIFYAYPFPGTPLYELCVKEGLLDEGEIPKPSYSEPAVPGLHLSIEEMTRLRRQALRRFYVRPSKVLRTLRGARSPAELANYLRAGFDQLRDLLSHAA